jgi:hypothetical protein
MVNGLFNAQINSLSRLAVYITEKIPDLITDVEFATIADAFGWTGDQQKGTQYWETAIAAPKDKYYEAQNRQRFADYLFRNGNIGAGSDQYRKVLELYPIRDDLSKYVTGFTHRMWGVNERQSGNETSAKENFDRAAEAYKTISIEGYRAFALADLDRARQIASSSALQPSAGEPSPSVSITQFAEPSERPLVAR